MRVLALAEAIEPAEVGGKAANLARLIASGAPVPHGFVIPNMALQHFIAEQEGLPLDVDVAVMAAWEALGPGPVIVRSSAVGEDSAEASFAGQLDSIAGVTTDVALRAAILHVWGSQWSDRAVAYQKSRGTFLAGMGIVVQRQIDARVSGVLFTVSPTSTSHMLVEYCEGLGEALVSGAVNPGRASIARDGLRWISEASLSTEDAGRPLLDDAQIATLAGLALRIERLFASPQDIEWTIGTDGRLWIVQSRPITGHGPTQAAVQHGSTPADTNHGSTQFDAGNGSQRFNTATVLWSNANVNENFPQPICPLLYSVARAGYYHYFRNLGRAFGISERRLTAMEPALRQIIGVHGARMYYNLTSIHDVLKSAPYGDLLSAWFDRFVGAEADDDSILPPAEKPRAYQALEVGGIVAKTTWQYLFLTARVEEFERAADRFAAETHPARLDAKTTRALAADLRAFMHIRCNGWKNASLADAGSMVCYGALQRLLARAFPADDQQALHNTLLKALPNLVSSMPPLRMWELSRMIRASEPLRHLIAHTTAAEALAQIRTDDRFASFNAAFETFLEAWGFRCSAELMLTVPSFQEDPAPVIDLLRSYAAMDRESPAELLERQSLERERDTKRVLSILRRRPLFRWLPIPQSVVVGTVLKWTQRSIQLRERARLKQALLYSRLRRIALALGTRLAQEGRLEQREDIFFLTTDEIDLLASGGEMFPNHVSQTVRLRWTAHTELSATSPPDSMRLAAGEYLTLSNPGHPAGPEDRQPRLTGVGACGGSKTATAAILLDVTDSHRLKAGDILVTRQTDPGWGAIFPLISGLVIERGGMLSHGAIIAREFGIPSVVGVKDATKLIPHGGSVTVDGDRGVVHLAPGLSPAITGMCR